MLVWRAPLATWALRSVARSAPAYHLSSPTTPQLRRHGAPWFRGDIADRRDRIALSASSAMAAARRLSTATNLIATSMGKDPPSAIDLVIADKGESSVHHSIMNEDTSRGRLRIR